MIFVAFTAVGCLTVFSGTSALSTNVVAGSDSDSAFGREL